MPSFFDKLPIPRKFTREFGNELSDIVQLKDPTSKIWQVTLEKIDGEIYFKSGWKKFVDFHSLGYGYMLVFNYVGNSHFTVQVFDTSTCENEYPSLEESPENNASEEESDNSVENLGVHNAADGNQQIKEHGKNFSVKQSSSALEDMEHFQERKTTRTVKLMGCCRYMSRRDLTPKKTHEALLKAENFQSDKPFFEAVIRPSYASFCTGLPIPARFVKDHFKRRPEVVKLCSDRGEWEVKCKYWKKGTFLFKGWSEFASMNNIKLGDVCIFELINKNMQFRVIIYHS